MRVWVSSPSRLFAELLVMLVGTWGFEASTEPEPAAEVALWDLTTAPLPLPLPAAVPTLAITRGDEVDDVRILQLRYRGCVGPADSPATLRRALEAVQRGEIWAGRQLLTKALDGAAAPPLTPKEQQVIQLLVRGGSNRAIAQQLGIGERTVKMHVSHVFEKYEVRNRSELIACLRVAPLVAGADPEPGLGSGDRSG